MIKPGHEAGVVRASETRRRISQPRALRGIPNEARERLLEEFGRWQLPEEFITELMDHSHCLPYASGMPVFLRGESADLIFWVLAGLVRIAYPKADGTRVLVQLAGPGDVIGFADAIAPSGRRIYAFEGEAVTKAYIALVAREQVISALRRLPPTKLVPLLELLNSSWSSVNSLQVRFLGLSFHERLNLVFEELGKRFGVRDSRGILITTRLSHEDLAEMIASSRPMVSRLIAEMVHQGVIARQGKHYVLLNKPAVEADANNGAGSRSRPGMIN
jgi:CRP-like cAMP-binding protein